MLTGGPGFAVGFAPLVGADGETVVSPIKSGEDQQSTTINEEMKFGDILNGHKVKDCQC